MRQLIRTLLFLLLIVTSTQLLTHFIPYYNFLDELLFLLLISITAVHFYSLRISRKKTLFFILFVLFYALSSIINYYSLIPLLIKSLYYIKTLLAFSVLSFLSSRFLSSKDINRVYTFALLMSVFSIAEFAYIQLFHFNNGVIYELWGLTLKSRNGIYRAAALTGHPISLGMLGLVSLIFSFEKKGVTNRWHIVLILGTILVSGSRIPLFLALSYLVIVGLDMKLFRIKELKLKYFIALVLPIILIIGIANLEAYIETNNEVTTSRGMAINKAFPLLKNTKNLVLGTGIGSFGMFESVEFNSPVYETINFPEHYKQIIVTSNRGTGIESFLTMIIIEMGIIGSFLYFILIFPIKQKYSYLEIFLIFSLLIYSIAYPLYTLPYIIVLNILFPYFTVKKDKE